MKTVTLRAMKGKILLSESFSCSIFSMHFQGAWYLVVLTVTKCSEGGTVKCGHSAVPPTTPSHRWHFTVRENDKKIRSWSHPCRYREWGSYSHHVLLCSLYHPLHLVFCLFVFLVFFKEHSGWKEHSSCGKKIHKLLVSHFCLYLILRRLLIEELFLLWEVCAYKNYSCMLTELLL